MSNEDKKVKKGTIKMVIGGMFSGKTSEMAREWERRDSIGMIAIVINHVSDTRYDTEEDDSQYMYSHSGRKVKCTRLARLDQLSSEILEHCHTILINEGQFFPDLKKTVMNWCENYGKEIIVSGLDGDFQREKFGDILDLVPLADEVSKIKALCARCKNGTEALFSMRITDEKAQTVIGYDNYIPVCREHYCELLP